MRIKTFVYCICAMACGYIAGYHRNGISACRDTAGDREVHTDTVIVRDTLRITVGVPVERVVQRRIMIPADDISDDGMGDSVSLPITQAIYADSAYRAVVSGVRPRLDSLTFYAPMPMVTRTEIRRSSPWSVGVTAGVAMTPYGISPSLGIGISYRLFGL